MKMKNKKEKKTDYNGLQIALIYFILGTIICYLGGLYGSFEKNILLAISGILLKIWAIVLLAIALWYWEIK